MSEYRLYRSASNPDYLQHVIEPMLVEREMDVRFASAVAGLMDFGYSPEAAIQAIRSVMV